MNRRLEPLTPERLDGLPDRCRACLFWELGRPRPAADPGGDELAGDALVQKQAWCTAQSLESGPPGRVLRLDGEVAAYALYASPDRFAPRRAPVPRASDDALLLATLWVAPHLREQGVGRLLVHAAVREALQRDLDAVEAYADRRFRDRDCVLPATWLLHEGFEVHREHPRHPLLRLETQRTVRWADSLGDAVEGILGRVRPEPGPATVPQRFDG